MIVIGLKNVFALAVIVLFINLYVKAQQVDGQKKNIKGNILNQKQMPVENINLELKNIANPHSVFYSYTDSNGNYAFNHIADGIYTLFLSSPHMIIDSLTIQIDSTTRQFPQITINDHDHASLDSVIIKGSKPKPIIEVYPDKTVFNVQNNMSASGQNALELLRKAPGVTLDKDNNINIKGVAGVRVFVDGKPTYLSNENLTQFLNSLQADNIESIEVIAHPSAKYEAEGAGGIINIVLKKGSKKKGFNGTASSNQAIIKTIFKYEGKQNIDLNYVNTKYMIHASVGGYVNNAFDVLSLDRILSEGVINETTRSYYNYKGLNTNVGLDYTINPRHAYAINLRVNYTNDQSSDNYDGLNYKLNNNQNIFDYWLNNFSNSPRHTLFVVPNASYTYKHKKFGELILIADWSVNTSNVDTHLENVYYASPNKDHQTKLNVLQQITQSESSIYSSKIDWNKPITENITLSAGAKYTNAFAGNSFESKKNFTPLSALQIDPLKSNIFNYKEIIYASYIQMQLTLFKDFLNINAGLRHEYTYRNAMLKDFVNTNELKDIALKPYNNFFPSLSFSFNFSPNHMVTTQVNRRILRPSYMSLNPFQTQISDLFYNVGNPQLNPEISLSTDLSYTLFKNFTLATGYTVVDNVNSNVPTNRGDTLILKPQNLGSSHTFFASFNSTFSLLKIKRKGKTNKTDFWTMLMNINYNKQKNKAFYNGQDVEVNFGTFNLYAETNFLLTNTTALIFSSWINGPGVWQFSIRNAAFGTLDVALKQKFLKSKKLSCTLFYRDLLNTTTIKFQNDDKGIGSLINNGRIAFTYGSFGINLTYQFGIDAERKQKKSSLDEERKSSGFAQ